MMATGLIGSLMYTDNPATIPLLNNAKRKLAEGSRIKLEIAMGIVKTKSERPFET
ncbi:MAG: hypothetical protein MZV64_19385 [Ignavibacteriales bacterium]|nr:hypothetical protein [Ignavibacteriales bacterium]